MRTDRSTRLPRIFAIPGILAAASLAGLVAGLLGDGALDLMSWTALGTGPAAIGWALARSRRR